MRADGQELSANNLRSRWGTKSVSAAGEVWAEQLRFHDQGKRTALLLMGGNGTGMEDGELSCHQVANLLPLKTNGAVEYTAAPTAQTPPTFAQASPLALL